jgi:hypothetical protein
LKLPQESVVLSGKSFKLSKDTVGIQLVRGETSIAHLPSGSVIKVLSGPNENGKIQDQGIVYVIWEENTVALFAVDVQVRGSEVRKDSAKA